VSFLENPFVDLEVIAQNSAGLFAGQHHFSVTDNCCGAEQCDFGYGTEQAAITKKMFVPLEAALIFPGAHASESGSVRTPARYHFVSKRDKIRPVSRVISTVEKNLGEQSRKLANFVRHPKLLITKVSAHEWPGVP
jgi:hypothetical protein